MSYSPYTSTFQEFIENQQRKAAEDWLDLGDWIRYIWKSQVKSR